MKREIEILKYLSKKSEFVSIDELASVHNVSTRSIREDLKKIEEVLNKTDVGFIRSRTKGVCLKISGESEIYNIIRQMNDNDGYYSKEERISIILYEILILNTNCIITYDYLMEKTNTTKATLIKDFRECEAWFEKRKIKVIKTPSLGISFRYDEIDFRNAAIEYIESYFNKADLQSLYSGILSNKFLVVDVSVNDYIRKLKSGINLTAINNLIKKCENDWQIKFSEDSFIKIFLYILVAVSRAKEGNPLTIKNTLSIGINIDNWIKENSKYLCLIGKYDLSRTEMEYIYYFMISQNKIFLHPGKGNTQFDEEKIVRDFISSVQNLLLVDLVEDKALFDSISMHMDSTIYRMLFDIKITNPLKNEIKNNYSDIYKACKKAGKIIENIFNKELSDDEISFLTMHIAVSLEKRKDKKK